MGFEVLEEERRGEEREKGGGGGGEGGGCGARATERMKVMPHWHGVMHHMNFDSRFIC